MKKLLLYFCMSLAASDLQAMEASSSSQSSFEHGTDERICITCLGDCTCFSDRGSVGSSVTSDSLTTVTDSRKHKREDAPKKKKKKKEEVIDILSPFDYEKAFRKEQRKKERRKQRKLEKAKEVNKGKVDDGDGKEEKKSVDSGQAHGQGEASSGFSLSNYGLKNQGASCYFNASLQCLATCGADVIVTDEKSPRYMTFVQKIVNHLFSSKLMPNFLLQLGFKSQARALFSSNYGQQDAQLCLTGSIDGLVSTSRAHFEIDLQSRLTCQRCGNSRTNPELVRDEKTGITQRNTHLALSLPREEDEKNVTLEELFGIFQTTEMLDGDNKVSCPDCKMPTTTTKQMLFANFSRHVFIQLKRFSFVSGIPRKNSIPVAYPPQFTFGDDKTYNLTGIIYHSGTLRGGHYTAHRRLPDGSWIYCDDNKIYSGAVSVQGFTPYILMYTLADSAPAVLPEYKEPTSSDPSSKSAADKEDDDGDEKDKKEVVNLVCCICKKTCKTKSLFMAHLAAAHKKRKEDPVKLGSSSSTNHEDATTVQCTWAGCTRRFKRPSNLKVHLRTHTGEKPFPCTWPGCTRRFKSLSNQKVHLLLHKKEKPYACDECGKRFRKKWNIQSHKITHHGHPSPYKCIACQQEFSSRSALKYHIKHNVCLHR